LAEFFFEGHAGEEGVEILGGSGCGQQDRENQDVADMRLRIALSGPGMVDEKLRRKTGQAKP
jgi:hypothetical protein